MAEVGGTSQTPQRSIGRTIARNTAFGIGAQFALKFARILFNVLVVNALGGAQFGQYSIVTAWAGLFSVLGDLGVTQYLAREIARDPSKKDQLFWDTVIIRFFLAILCSAITVAGAILAGYSHEIVLALVVFTGTYFFQVVIAPLNSVLTGSERVDIQQVLEVVMQVTTMIFSTLFLLMHLDFVWLFIAGIINLPIVIALQVWAIRRNKLSPPRFHINPGMWMALIRFGLPFGMIQLSLSFAFRADTVVLSQYKVSDAEIGMYNVAYNLVLMLLGISISFNTAILPTLAREHTVRPETVKTWYYSAARMMFFIGLPVTIGTMLLAPKIINFLYPHKPDVFGSWVPLSILIWDLPFVIYHSFCGNIVQSIKREGSAARVYVSLGIFNILANLFLVPRFGIIGSSFATVITDFLGAAQYYFILRHEFGAGLGFRRLARIAACAVIMGIVVFLLRDWNVILVSGVGAVIYLVTVWFSDAFSPEERNRLVSAITRRLRASPHPA
jgi:O-antigen/teichoic acid export membrane protein